jgi:hypothetical protein
MSEFNIFFVGFVSLIFFWLIIAPHTRPTSLLLLADKEPVLFSVR